MPSTSLPLLTGLCRRAGFVNQSGSMRVNITVTLKPVGSGAKIALHAEGILAGKIKHEMESNLARLKAVLLKSVLLKSVLLKAILESKIS